MHTRVVPKMSKDATSTHGMGMTHKMHALNVNILWFWLRVLFWRKGKEHLVDMKV